MTVVALSTPAQAHEQTDKQTYKEKYEALKTKVFFMDCEKSQKFNEKQVHFAPKTIQAGRCVTSKKAGKGIKLIGSRAGHHPSAGKALDLMVNTQGSCNAGQETGNKTAKHFMDHSEIYGVEYIIWNNRYWNAREGHKPLHQWKYMGRDGCTHGHYDHVHLAMK